MSVKLLIEHYLELLSLKGGCTGSYEATLVKTPHCWKSRVTAQKYLTVQASCILYLPAGHNFSIAVTSEEALSPL